MAVVEYWYFRDIMLYNMLNKMLSSLVKMRFISAFNLIEWLIAAEHQVC